MWRKWFKIFGFKVVEITDYAGTKYYRILRKTNDIPACWMVDRKIILDSNNLIFDPKWGENSYLETWKYI